MLLSLQQAASASVISPVPSTRQQGVINVDDSPTIISDSAERTLTVKIRMRSGIRKLQMKAVSYGCQLCSFFLPVRLPQILVM